MCRILLRTSRPSEECWTSCGHVWMGKGSMGISQERATPFLGPRTRWVAAQTELFPMGAHTLDPWPPGRLSQCVVILKTIVR